MSYMVLFLFTSLLIWSLEAVLAIFLDILASGQSGWTIQQYSVTGSPRIHSSPGSYQHYHDFTVIVFYTQPIRGIWQLVKNQFDFSIYIWIIKQGSEVKHNMRKSSDMIEQGMKWCSLLHKLNFLNCKYLDRGII